MTDSFVPKASSDIIFVISINQIMARNDLSQYKPAGVNDHCRKVNLKGNNSKIYTKAVMMMMIYLVF